jgi:hypothetical protein
MILNLLEKARQKAVPFTSKIGVDIVTTYKMLFTPCGLGWHLILSKKRCNSEKSSFDKYL